MVHSGQTRIDVFHESVPAWGKVRFHCRFERAVYDWYRRHPRHISRAIRYALMKFRLAFDGGVFNLACCSRFLSRDDVGDKVEARIMLTVAHKDLLEKLAASAAQRGVSFISLYFGADVSEDDARAAGKLFEAACPGAEISVLSGGQPGPSSSTRNHSAAASRWAVSRTTDRAH